MKLVKVVIDGSPVNYLTEIEKGENLESGVYIIVETSRGLELAKTICNSYEVESNDVSFKEEANLSSLLRHTARSVQAPTETKVISPGWDKTWSIAHLMPFPIHSFFFLFSKTGPSKPFAPWIFPAKTLSLKSGPIEPAKTGASISKASVRFKVFSRVYSLIWFPAVAIKPSITISSFKPPAKAMATASS